EAAGLVAEDPVDPRNSLHEAVAAHGLVDIQRVHTGAVKAGQPHIPDDDQLQGVRWILETLCEFIPPGFVPGVLGDLWAFAGVAGHDDLDGPLVVVVVVPLGADLGDRIVERHADPAGHRDDHGLAVHGGEAVLEVGDDVGRDLIDTALRA